MSPTDSVGPPTESVGDAGTVGGMSRPFRHQVDEGILDRAAALFARHGFEQTSLKAVADAVGLSKAGLLHHFPSKEALYDATLALCRARAERVLDRVGPMPPGVARDRLAVEMLIDFAFDRPGLVALILGSITALGADDRAGGMAAIDAAVLRSFGVDPATSGPERLIRVSGAMAALAVLALAAHHVDDRTTWRPHIVSTCLDALGHARSDRTAHSHAAHSHIAHDQVED